MCIFCNLRVWIGELLHASPCLLAHRGKMKRAVGQFTPYYWTNFQWGYTQSFTRFLFVFILAIIVSLGGNTMYRDTGAFE